MKQRLAWVLVPFVLLSGLVVLLLPKQPEVRQRTELSFLYFTNGAKGPLVLFAVHFPKHYGGGGWHQTELDHWEGGKWTPWNPPGTGRAAMDLQGGAQMGTVAANGKRIDLIAGFFLPNTNDSWRIRNQVDEQPLSLKERLPFLKRYQRRSGHVTADPRLIFTYSMTNEIGPAGLRP